MESPPFKPRTSPALATLETSAKGSPALCSSAGPISAAESPDEKYPGSGPCHAGRVSEGNARDNISPF